MKPVRRQTSGWPRVGCLVPGCGRGTTRIQPNEDGEQGEYVCGRHWPMVPKSLKRRLARARKAALAAGRRQDRDAWDRWWRIFDRLWFRIRAGLVVGHHPADQMPMAMRADLEREALL